MGTQETGLAGREHGLAVRSPSWFLLGSGSAVLSSYLFPEAKKQNISARYAMRSTPAPTHRRG